MNFILGQTLYAATKTGNVKTWCCNVQQDVHPILTIVTQTKLGGKPVIRREVFTEGKNIGRSNETTPYQQAVSEAESRYRKKIDQGYSTEIPTDTTKAGANALGLPKPMLAHPIDKVKEVTFPAFFQPKLDGHRAIVTKRDGEMVMYSRQGKSIATMGHILNHLADKMEDDMFLDGELYLHGEALQKIGSYIKKRQPDSEKITYHVYDVMMDVTYQDRLAVLLTMGLNEPGSPVVIVPTTQVATMEGAQALTELYIEEGYEGGILRTPDEGYLAGFRSRNLLKIKQFDDSEHTIIDVVEGKDRIVNDTELKVACFICETPEGKRFECTAYGDQYEKDRIWHNRESFKGRVLTVKHSGYTKDGVPWHPVALRLREDI